MAKKFKFSNEGNNCVAAAHAIFFDCEEILKTPGVPEGGGHTDEMENKIVRKQMRWEWHLTQCFFDYRGMRLADFKRVKRQYGLDGDRFPGGMVFFSATTIEKGFGSHATIWLFSPRDNMFHIIDSNCDEIVSVIPEHIFAQMNERKIKLFSLRVMHHRTKEMIRLFHPEQLPHLF